MNGAFVHSKKVSMVILDILIMVKGATLWEGKGTDPG